MRIRVRSIFTTIVLWFTVTFVLSLVGYVVTSMLLSARLASREPVLPRLTRIFVNDARRAYEEGGAPRLSEYLARLESYTEVEHIFVDERGRDLVDGQDRSALLAQRGSRAAPGTTGPPRPRCCGCSGRRRGRGRPCWSAPPGTADTG